MNIGQFRRHLETLPDDALVVFQSENPDTSLAFPAMAVSFTANNSPECIAPVDALG